VRGPATAFACTYLEGEEESANPWLGGNNYCKGPSARIDNLTPNRRIQLQEEIAQCRHVGCTMPAWCVTLI